VLSPAAVAQAQSSQTSAAAPTPSVDTSLTLYGITFYGTIDAGLRYQTHAAPSNDYFVNGTVPIISKSSYHSELAVTPSNLSQSKLGLTGNEPLFGDWASVFRLETYFNPQSGEIPDMLKTLAQNNGRPPAQQTSNADASLAGQLFEISYAGMSSPTYGTLTFGRQYALLADGVRKYDPLLGSIAFSLVGYSGTMSGGGDTEDRRLNNSLKYIEQYRGMHFAAEYQFNGSSGSASTAWGLQLGGEFAGISLDTFYTDVKDAISAALLTAEQVAELPKLGYSPSNSLAGTISDNTSYGIMGLTVLGPARVSAGYVHIRYANPSTPLSAGFVDEGGYMLAFVNNSAYDNERILQWFWAGVRYSVTPALDLAAAYYGYTQNSYATGKNVGCSGTQVPGCSGTVDAFSFTADYRLSKRFDVYFGVEYSSVQGGLASGYLSTSTVDPTFGLRFQW
jgi:predicted porin